MTACPFCGEGPIYQAVVKENLETIYICAECDTVWKRSGENTELTNYTSYMRRLGKSPLWDELELISVV